MSGGTLRHLLEPAAQEATPAPVRSAPFSVAFERADRPLARLDGSILAVFEFSGLGPESGIRDPRVVNVPLPQLGAVPVREIWRSAIPVRRAWNGGLGYAHNGTVVVGQIWIPEEVAQDVESATVAAYRAIFPIARSLGYRHMLRLWHYVHDVNAGDGDEERYKRFCVGRGKALDEARASQSILPAATAVGTRTPGLLVHFLASRSQAEHVGNPRQLNAYEYPREYGPRPPMFSRATTVDWDAERHIYAAGTASIVGHESAHPGDPEKQMDEILRNLRALALNAGRVSARSPEPVPQLLRVYVRNPSDLDPLRRRLEATAWRNVPAVYLRADICRRELLVEAEALFRIGSTNDTSAPAARKISARGRGGRERS